ncbi:MAG: hypothetical protein ACTSQ8_19165 [Candidatus Helarchaeota archaeon]
MSKHGSSLSLNITEQLKTIDAMDSVQMVWSPNFILITSKEVFHPIQHVVGLDKEKWLEFVGFCVKRDLKYEDALTKAIMFFIRNYDSLLLKFKEGFWDKDFKF